MNKAKIQALLQQINKINLDNRRRPEVARALSAEAIDTFVLSSGDTREELIDKLQSKLEENSNQIHLIQIIEMLKQYV